MFAENSRPGFSHSELAFITALCVVVAISTLFWGYNAIEREQQRQLNQQAQTLFNNAGVQLAETGSFIASIEGMHYASDEFAGADIEAFVSRVREHSPYLLSLGMFQDLAGDMRPFYERYMANEGHDDFLLHRDSVNGERLPQANQARYLPIHTVSPPDDPWSSLLGTDLLSSTELAGELTAAIDTATSFIIETPPGWPLGAAHLLIQPVYLGSAIPATLAERRELFTGGIWISIDLAKLMYPDGGRASALQGVLSLELKSGSDVTRIMISDASDANPLGLDLGFDTLHQDQTWLLGDSHLRLTWQAAPRAPMQGVLFTLALATALLAIIGSALVYVRSRRRSHWERIENLRALNREREKAELTLSSISDAVISLNSEHQLIYMNASAIRFLLVDMDYAMGTRIDQILFIDTAHARFKAFPGFDEALRQLPPHARAEYDVALKLPHLKDVTVKLTLTSMCDENNSALGSIVVLEDVSVERRLTAELERRAHYDSLTGCINRFYFETQFHQLLDDMPHSQQEHALCFIDLDNFKTVNDTCGHPAGDALLIEITEALRNTVRDQDMLARLGGDEFAVILVDCDETRALAIANEVHEFFSNYVFEQDGQTFPVSGSIGFVAITEQFNDFKTIIKAADSCCYAAKESGRNALVVYSADDMDLDGEQEANWLPLLNHALDNDAFELLATPVARINDRRKPAHSHFQISPQLITPAGDRATLLQYGKSAERFDLMTRIDRQVLHKLIRVLSHTSTTTKAPLCASLRLSSPTLADPSSKTYITEELAKADLAASHLWFEISEPAASSNMQETLSLIDCIHALGGRIILDNFGAGVGTIKLLQKLEFDILKIDPLLVESMEANPESLRLIKAIGDVAKAKQAHCMAPGVTSASILEQLTLLGIDYALGPHIAEAFPLEQALSDWRRDIAA